MEECVFVANNINLIDINFGGKCLIAFKDNVLRCAHFLRYEIEIGNWTRLDTKYVFDVASIGIKKLNIDDIKFIFKNVDDYKSRKPIGIAQLDKKYAVESCFPKGSFTIVGKSSYSYGKILEFVRWRWNGISAYSEIIKCPQCVIHDEYGYHFNEKFSFEPNTYATKEECENNNEIKIIDFDDEVENTASYSEETTIVKDSLGNTHTFTLVIDRKNGAVVKATIEN